MSTLLTATIAGILASAGTHARASASELDRLVADTCDKQVVMLGEDVSHGSGAAIELKAQVVERLIDQCHFSAVVFESGIYDFIGLERALSGGSATREQLADAIGGLWSTTAEMAPLIDYLFVRAERGELRLMGMDFQAAGATYGYAQHRLASDLFHFMPEGERQICRDAVATFTQWKFDDDTPFDEAFRARMHNCLDRVSTEPGNEDAALARNLLLSIRTPADDFFNTRDRAMYENLIWHRARLGADAKIVVWTATIHGAKHLAPLHDDRTPTGELVHGSLGRSSAVIGITAFQGSYGRDTKSPIPLTMATESSLEHKALSTKSDEVRYLDSDELNKLGKISSRAIDYTRPANAQWNHIVDGLLVMPRDRPPHFVHTAAPRHNW